MNRSLRFCMVTTSYPPHNFGGDGIFVYRLSNELAQRGHQVEIIHCLDSFYSLHSNEPNGQYPNHPDVTVHSLKSGAGVLSPLWTHHLGSPGLKSGNIKRIMENGKLR